MGEKRQGLKIRTKLCWVKSGITGAERMGARENTKRQGSLWQRWGDINWTLNERWDLGGCQRQRGTGRRHNGRAFVSNINYLDFLNTSAAGLELPRLFLLGVSEKHSWPSLPLQCVEGPSRGRMGALATRALMLVMFRTSTASGLSALKKERWVVSPVPRVLHLCTRICNLCIYCMKYTER